MNAGKFQQENGERWDRLAGMLDDVERNRASDDIDALPALFRQTCHDLSVARRRMYGPALTRRLNALAIRGYRALERTVSGGHAGALRLLAVDFPRAVRAEWRLFWFCMVVFWTPFVTLAVWTQRDPGPAMAVLGTGQMAQLEKGFGGDPADADFGSEEFGSDFMMFGFYVYNNVSIDLRTFAGGLLCGIGSLAILLFNGIALGSATGYIHLACDPRTFYAFTSGHGGPELMAIVISGMAGLRLGLSWVMPGRHDRRTSLVLGGRKALVLLTGACAMTFVAAIIEGFWSARPLPPTLKYSVGIAVWCLTLWYLAFCGRIRHAT